MTLASKLAAASLKVGGALATDKVNKEQNYPYVSADKLIAVCGQALAEQGIAIMPEITTWHVEAVAFTNSRGNQGTRHDAAVAFLMKITDGEESAESPWVGLGSDYTVPDKALYKAITSGHRYFLAKLLNVGAGNEDGEHESGEGDDGHSEKKVSTTKLPIATGPVPNCPKCGGPMWDNRTTKTNPKQPDFKCKDKSNCDGAIWPPKDAPAERMEEAGRPVFGDEPPGMNGDLFDDAPPPVEAAPATSTQIQLMGIIAQKLYNKDEMESVFRPWLRENYHVDSRKALTTAQAADVIAKLQAAADKLGK